METHRIFETSSYEAPVAAIVHDVFDTMLNYPVDQPQEDYEARTEIVTAAIFFAGSRQGAVILECTQARALYFAARLMNIPAPASMDDDTRDSLGEIVNMIGGNLKSVLLPGVGLSMPSVLEGADHAYKICGANLKERISFRGPLGPLWLTLVQMAPPAEWLSKRNPILRESGQAQKYHCAATVTGGLSWPSIVMIAGTGAALGAPISASEYLWLTICKYALT